MNYSIKNISWQPFSHSLYYMTHRLWKITYFTSHGWVLAKNTKLNQYMYIMQLFINQFQEITHTISIYWIQTSAKITVERPLQLQELYSCFVFELWTASKHCQFDLCSAMSGTLLGHRLHNALLNDLHLVISKAKIVVAALAFFSSVQPQETTADYSNCG